MTSATRSVQGAARISGCENCQARERRIARQAERFLERGRLRGAVARQPARGDASISPIVEPASIDVGATRTFQYEVIATRQSNLIEPGTCVDPTLNHGFSVEMVATVDGSRVTRETTCLGPTAPHTLSFSLEGTEPGTVTVEVVVSIQGAPTVLQRHRSDVEIVAESENGGGGGAQPGDDNGDPDDDDDNGGGPLLPCFLDPNRSCARPETLAWGGAGLLVLTLLVGN